MTTFFVTHLVLQNNCNQNTHMVSCANPDGNGNFLMSGCNEITGNGWKHNDYLWLIRICLDKMPKMEFNCNCCLLK